MGKEEHRKEKTCVVRVSPHVIELIVELAGSAKGSRKKFVEDLVIAAAKRRGVLQPEKRVSAR